jgi:hypothetical protein
LRVAAICKSEMPASTQYCTDPEVVPQHLSDTPKYVVTEEEPKYTIGDSSLEVDYGRDKLQDTAMAAATVHDSKATQGKDWWRERQRNKWCVRLEAAIAALIVIAIVVRAVVGTEAQRNKSSSSSSSSTTDSDVNGIPIGRTFTLSFALPGSNCSNACGLAVSVCFRSPLFCQPTNPYLLKPQYRATLRASPRISFTTVHRDLSQALPPHGPVERAGR